MRRASRAEEPEPDGMWPVMAESADEMVAAT